MASFDTDDSINAFLKVRGINIPVEDTPAPYRGVCHVNGWQENHTRLEKYDFIMTVTRDSIFSRRLRDWRWKEIARWLSVYLTSSQLAIPRASQAYAETCEHSA